MRHLTACIASAAIALAAMTFAAPAYAQDDIGSNPITEFFDGLGFGAKEKPDIDYQERAPLVPPPSTASLPQPQAPGASRTGAAWPNDPDVQARAERRALSDRVPTETNSYRMGERGSRLDPDEIGARRVRGASVPATAAAGTTSDNTVTRLSPEELATRRTATAQVSAAPAADGPRNRLTDPPSGYLTGSGDVTAQPPAEQKSWLGRMFGN